MTLLLGTKGRSLCGRCQMEEKIPGLFPETSIHLSCGYNQFIKTPSGALLSGSGDVPAPGEVFKRVCTAEVRFSSLSQPLYAKQKRCKGRQSSWHSLPCPNGAGRRFGCGGTGGTGHTGTATVWWPSVEMQPCSLLLSLTKPPTPNPPMPGPSWSLFAVMHWGVSLVVLLHWMIWNLHWVILILHKLSFPSPIAGSLFHPPLWFTPPGGLDPTPPLPALPCASQPAAGPRGEAQRSLVSDNLLHQLWGAPAAHPLSLQGWARLLQGGSGGTGDRKPSLGAALLPTLPWGVEDSCSLSVVPATFGQDLQVQPELRNSSFLPSHPLIYWARVGAQILHPCFWQSSPWMCHTRAHKCVWA